MSKEGSLTEQWRSATEEFVKTTVTIDHAAIGDNTPYYMKVSNSSLAGCLAYRYNNQPLPALSKIEISGEANVRIENGIANLSGNFSAKTPSGKLLIANGEVCYSNNHTSNRQPALLTSR